MKIRINLIGKKHNKMNWKIDKLNKNNNNLNNKN